ncbi:MAG: ABC transporter permease [bacterium]|nr:ABC transporter permease [bacterium]
MKRFFRMYMVEQRLFFRSPDVIVFNLLMPLVALMLIAMIAGGQPCDPSGLTFLESASVALTTVGVCCSALMSIPIIMVEYRAQGVLRRMYCSPCPPARLLMCDTIASGVMAALSALLVMLASTLLLGYRMAGSALAFAGVWLITMAAMFSIGLMVASLCRTTRSMNVVTSLLYFPMLLFSGASIPLEVFPAPLRAIGGWTPLGVGIRLLKSVSLGCYNDLFPQLLCLIAIAAVCTTVAVKTFRWE